jgi:hypothetical protein
MSERAPEDELREIARSLAPALRARVAAEWARAAQAEHASIASFARFTLQLLAVGAPAELVADAQRAALDEIAHASRAFAIASVYSGVSLGPGSMPIDEQSLGPWELEGVIRGTVEEGCVGETLAAAEAEAARDAVKAAVLRQALERVARDEAAHAALAFRFVSWAVEVGGPVACNAAREAFARAVARARNEPLLEGVEEQALREHGRLPAAERRTLRLETVERVIEPAARELLGE